MSSIDPNTSHKQEAAKQTGSATLTLHNKQYELPVFSGSVGPDVLDISKLYGQSGAFTYDPGFTSTAACKSDITYIDGDKGVLLYRGYPIEQLAEQGNFLETCHILLYGDLPSKQQYLDFKNRVTYHTMTHEQMNRFFSGFRRDAHPMAVMVGTVGALSAFYHDSIDITDPIQRDIASIRMIAKMPTIAAMAYKYSIGQPFIYPRNELDYASNFLYMTFAVPSEEYKVNPVLSRAMDRIFVLHADHEQNASTSTVRLAGLLRREPVRLHRGRHRLPVGPGAWRRERSRAQDADGYRYGRPHPRVHQAREGQERSLPPERFRAPGLQELRSARAGDAEDLQGSA